MKINKTKFSFLRAKGSTLEKMWDKVNTILVGVVNAKPYILNWEDVLAQYDELGVGDVAEFSSGYTFGWHAKNRKLDDDASKQAMYLEIIDGIAERRENVK